MEKNYKKINIAVFLIFIFGSLILNIVVKSKEFSEEENRYLQQVPEVSFNSLKSGKLSEDFEKYVTDQFPFRDFFVGAKSYMEGIRGMKENNGVIIGEDGYLFSKFKRPKEELVQENIKYLEDFKKKNKDILMSIMLVPTSAEVLKGKLPFGVSSFDQEKIEKSIYESLKYTFNTIPVRDNLIKHKEEDIYYKLDHHWSTLGAYYGYESYCDILSLEKLSLEDFNREIIRDDFYGTLYSKFKRKNMASDNIEVFIPKEELNSKVLYVEEAFEKNQLYDYSALEKKDKYTFFLGGNHSLLKINNDIQRGEKKKLLVIKDSYAHNMIPFLCNNYEEIHVMDLRYYNKSSSKYILENNIDEVLFLYNIENFSEDVFLKKLAW